jgi:flagellar motor switch protein FliM
MAENVLSQDEIDALLSAVDKGDIDLELEDKKEQAKAEAKSYDLTSQSTMLRHQFYALEEVYDKFSKLLTRSLTSSLKKNIEVEFISTEIAKYGEFIQAHSNPTSFHIFNVEPLIGSSLLAIEPNLVFSLIDCMFGGEGEPLPEVREFTLIEQRMMRKFAIDVLKNFENSMEIVYPVNINLKKSETKPEYVHLVSPDELMVIVVLSVTGSGFTGNFHLCISYRMLEPIKDQLSSKYLREKDFEAAFSTQIQDLLKDTPVKIVAELGRATFTVRELLNFEVNDVVKLGNGPADPVLLNVQKIRKYYGFPGILKGSRAVQVTELIK